MPPRQFIGIQAAGTAEDRNRWKSAAYARGLDFAEFVTRALEAYILASSDRQIKQASKSSDKFRTKGPLKYERSEE